MCYRETGNGSFIAAGVGFPGEATVTGTLSALGTRGKQFTITTAQGPSLTFSTIDDSILPRGLAVGTTVQVTYTKHEGALTARSITITAAAPPSGSSGAATSS